MPEPDRRQMLAGLSSLALSSALPEPARATAPLLEPAAMRADVAVLYDAYATLHPGLYRYMTPADLLRERQRLDLFAATPRSLGEFYLALSAFTASIKCGHSYLNPSNQAPAISDALFDRQGRLPFAFVWLDGRMIVTADLGSGKSLAPGTEILDIDRVPARDMLSRMLPYARTDGSNVARRIADLGIPGDQDVPSFDILRPLLFPSGSAPSVRLSVRQLSGTATIECPLMAAADREAALTRAAPATSPYGWRFVVSHTVGILTMPTWAVFHKAWDWRGFIDASIDTAIEHGLPGIVIDLRDNGGGLDCGAAIIARLIAAPLATDSYSRHVRTRKVPDRLSRYLSTWDNSFRDWGSAAIGPDPAGFYTLERPADATDTDIIRPAGRRYTGKVVVLIGPKNASATFGFAALVKRHRLATLVGEPTGGNLRGINGGAFFFVHLPETQIEVDLPLIAYWPALPQPDAGVTPDIDVRQTVSDLAGRADRPLSRALMVASGGQ